MPNARRKSRHVGGATQSRRATGELSAWDAGKGCGTPRKGEMEDTNDRDAMLRLAAGYVRRAEDAARRMKIKAPARRFNVGAND